MRCSCSVGKEDMKEQELNAFVMERAPATNSPNRQAVLHDQYQICCPKSKTWWIIVTFCTIFLTFGQSSATLLGRLYYNKGGNCIYLVALLETLGFPILIPLALYFSTPQKNISTRTNSLPSPFILAATYNFLGLLQAATSIFYAIGLSNLHVSTFSLISATQLVFNALFSFFLNDQKFTMPLLNTLVLVTISSALLALHDESEGSKEFTRQKQLLGLSSTLVASALYSFLQSLTQLSFHKILKSETFTIVLNMIIYQSIVATAALSLVLFATNEWQTIGAEMENFESGKLTYATILMSIAASWQIYSIGAIGLVFEVSSLFSNVISAVALPIIPILSAMLFHDKMDGVKIICLFLAIWGFASYIYQHYLDGNESKTEEEKDIEDSEAFLSELCYITSKKPLGEE